MKIVFNDICWVVGEDKDNKIKVIPTVYSSEEQIMIDLRTRTCFSAENCDLAICNIFEKYNIMPVGHKFHFLGTNSACTSLTMYKVALHSLKDKLFLFASNILNNTTSFKADDFYYLNVMNKNVSSEDIHNYIRTIEHKINKDIINENALSC